MMCALLQLFVLALTLTFTFTFTLVIAGGLRSFIASR